MNTAIKISLVVITTCLSIACVKSEDTLKANPFSGFSLSASSNGEVALSQEKASEKVLELKWGGVADSPSTKYRLEIVPSDGKEAGWSETLLGDVTSRTFTCRELNNIIIDKCGKRKAEPAELKIRLTVIYKAFHYG